MTVRTLPTPRADAYATHPERKLALYYVVTALIFLALGVALGPLQALNYAGIDVYRYFPFIRSYYQGLTLHGVLNALVFTTYFISGLLIYLPCREMKLRPHLGFAWFTYWLMNFGVLLAAIAILSNSSSVLYTFYAPLKGSPLFYIGAALLIVSSLLVGVQTLWIWAGWRDRHRGQLTPIVTYMCCATWVMWILASAGIVLEVVFLLIPWSLGWVQTVDPLLSRTLFWWTGHPIVYFWLLPAYVSWYAFVPRQAGGALISEPLTRLTFAMFVLVSVPVGLHHQFTDPGISTFWKLMQMSLTFAVALPSMITAFSVAASLEYAARRRGGRGPLGWIRHLPWRDPSVAAQALAMVSFLFGGAGGIVNASFDLNHLLHNTAWIPGHFHITVGTATTLSFFGISFWLLPHLTGKPLWNPRMALWSAWSWFLGMMVFALGMHWEGLLGIPRRAHIAALPTEVYAEGARVPMALTGISGVILLVSAVLYYTVVLRTLTGPERDLERAPQIPFSEILSRAKPVGLQKVIDDLGLLFWVATALVLAAYLPTLIGMLRDPNLVHGWQLW